MKEQTIELKPCPFCGGKADIKHANIFMDEAYYVKCGSCYAMTKRFLVDHPRLVASTGELDEDTRYDALTAIKKAAEAWNRRAAYHDHGEWKEVEVFEPKFELEIASMRCSKCNRYINHIYHYGDPRDNINYCSFCGANMDGKENGDET